MTAAPTSPGHEPITPFKARLAPGEFVLNDGTSPPGSGPFSCAATASRDSAVVTDPERFALGADLGRAPRLRRPQLDGDPVFGIPTGISAMEWSPIGFEPAAG